MRGKVYPDRGSAFVILEKALDDSTTKFWMFRLLPRLDYAESRQSPPLAPFYPVWTQSCVPLLRDEANKDL
jgi:hypothetical protein